MCLWNWYFLQIWLSFFRFFLLFFKYWLKREIAQWVHPMKDRSDDPSHHERTLLPQRYISLPPVLEHWLEWEIGQWVHPMKDRSDDPSHHELHLAPICNKRNSRQPVSSVWSAQSMTLSQTLLPSIHRPLAHLNWSLWHTSGFVVPAKQAKQSLTFKNYLKMYATHF